MCLLRYFDMRLSSSLLWKLLLLCLRLLLAPLLEEKMVSLSLFSLSSLSLLSLLSLFSLFISLLSSLSVEVSRDELLYLQVVNACYLRRKIEKKLKEKGRREDHSSRTSLRRRIIIIIIIDSTTRRLILRGSSYPSIPCERNVGCLNDISDRIDGVIYRITPSIYREGKGSLLSELSKVEVCLLEVLGIIINHD